MERRAADGFTTNTTSTAPYDRLHGADQLLGAAFPGVDRRGRGLVQMGLGRSPHLAAVVVDMATLAVADRPVAMAPTAASGEAGDHGSPNMRATVLRRQEEEETSVLTSQLRSSPPHTHTHTNVS